MYVWTCIHACGKLSNLLRRSGLKGLKRSMGFKACIGPSPGSGLGLSLGAVEKLSSTCLQICLSVLLREMYTYTYMYMQTYMYMCTYRYTVHVSLHVHTAVCPCIYGRMSTYIRTCMRPCGRSCVRAHVHACARSYMRSRMRAYVRPPECTYARRLTYERACMYIR